MSTFTPTGLKQLGPYELGIDWNDGHASVYSVRRIRLECRCANCVDEWTRQRILKEEQVPSNIKPMKIEPVGRYALNFTWSDGHDTGIYTFEQLRSLCECGQCKQV